MREIRIYKERRILEFWQDNEMKASFKMSLGFSPVGEKIMDGDGRTPEGSYYICTKNPNSKFTLFLGISYPGIEDAERGLQQRLISAEEYDAIRMAIENGKRPSWDTALGGKIGIHGMGSSRDWTAGCVALEDEDIIWLWDHIEKGDTVQIYK